MFLETVRSEGLSHLSYLVGARGAAQWSRPRCRGGSAARTSRPVSAPWKHVAPSDAQRGPARESPLPPPGRALTWAFLAAT